VVNVVVILRTSPRGWPRRRPARYIDGVAEPSEETRRSTYPDQPGVYIMRDVSSTVIYVGKAKSLRKRIASYFSGQKDLKTQTLVRHIHDVEVIVTGSEHEAFLLENTLIKRWKPRYNINLKDGKTYPVIKVTNEPFPRVYRTRRIVFDGSSYYGPFPRAHVIDAYLELVNRLFPLRKCRGPLKPREHPCLNWHIGRCSGACAGKTSADGYRERVEHVRKLLSGRSEDLLRELKGSMQSAAGALEYERAATYRDQIEAVREISETQKVVDFTAEDRDYVGLARRGERYAVTVLQVRDGKLVGREHFDLTGPPDEVSVLAQFLERYYEQVQSRPGTVYVPMALAGEDLAPGTSVRYPQRGKHARSVELACENAREALSRIVTETGMRHALEHLREALSLPTPPRRIEGFDISHLDGEHTVGSMVCFVDGEPEKPGYRFFRLRHLGGRIDDYDALREVVARRYTRVVAESLPRPDLVLVDGGKGQVSAVHGILTALGLEGMPLVGLAKEQEEIHRPGGEAPLRLDPSTDALRLLIAVRDEAHRFANSLRKRLAAARLETSVFERIPGVGPKRARRLIEIFGEPARLRGLSADDVARATGFGLEIAAAVLAYVEAHRGTPPDTGTGTGAGPADPSGVI
jgi:excinuclease ABC subunit C